MELERRTLRLLNVCLTNIFESLQMPCTASFLEEVSSYVIDTVDSIPKTAREDHHRSFTMS